MVNGAFYDNRALIEKTSGAREIKIADPNFRGVSARTTLVTARHAEIDI